MRLRIWHQSETPAFSGNTTLWCVSDRCWNVWSPRYFNFGTFYWLKRQEALVAVQRTVVFSNSLPTKKKKLPNFLNTCFSFQGPVIERLVWHGREFRWSQNQIRQCNWFMCVSSGILSGSCGDSGVQRGGQRAGTLFITWLACESLCRGS